MSMNLEITAGRFLALNVLAKNFGRIRVRETGVILRKYDFFPTGWEFLNESDVANFLYSISAAKPKDAAKALKFADRKNPFGSYQRLFRRIYPDRQGIVAIPKWDNPYALQVEVQTVLFDDFFIELLTQIYK